MLKVIVFNGAPRSGKDSAANHMVQSINTLESNLVAYKQNFKDMLIDCTCRMLNVNQEAFLFGYDMKTSEYSSLFGNIFNDTPEWFKDYPMYTVHKDVLSKRQALIHCSENVFKPMLGSQVFGDMFANNMPEEGLVFCGDSGFKEELQPVVNKIGSENVLVVRVFREGCTFDNDSRDYLLPEMFDGKVSFVDIDNNSTEEDFLKEVELCVGEWLNAEK